MKTLSDDLRFVLRLLIRQPLFSVLAVLTLTLGIGMATAIYTVVDRVLLRPMAYPDGGRLVALCETNASVEGFCIASPPNAADWAAGSRTVSAIGQARSWSFHLGSTEGTTGVSAGWATADMFRVLGLRPALGRLLTSEDLATDRRIAVLSDELWRVRFGADSGVVGRTVTLDGVPHEVVGVLPPGAVVPHLGRVTLWVGMPADARAEDSRRWRGFVTVGRLAPGATIAAAQAELSGIQRALAERHPDVVGGWGVAVHPLLDDVVGSVRPTLLVFLGAVALLLLVACANVAHLLLARGAVRAREFAVRAALGARPARLFRLVIAESLLLSLLGGAGGLLLAVWATDLFLALMPIRLPRAAEVGVDGRVFAGAALLMLVTGVVAGLVPALRAARADVAEMMKEGHPGSGWRGGRRWRSALLVAEFAMAFVLVTGAGLLTRTFTATQRWEPGFDTEGLVTFWTSASSGTYPTSARVADLFARIRADLRTLPGVTAVGSASAGPLFGGEETGEFFSAGHETDPPVAGRWYDMGAGTFTMLGVRLRLGRDFTAADGAGAPRVAIVNETMARRLWPGRDAVGERLSWRDFGDGMEVVGVVADVPPLVPGQATAPEVYWPHAQSPRWASYFLLRTSGDPAALARAMDQRLAAIDPDLRASSFATMHDLVRAELKRPRFNMLLIGVFGAVALVLTAVGVFGVMAASVAGRTREIGVRVALGAGRWQVAGMVVGQSLALAAAGLALGALASALLARLAASLIHGVAPTDPITYLAVALLLLLVAVAASLVPARRAGTMDPMEALRAT